MKPVSIKTKVTLVTTAVFLGLLLLVSGIEMLRVKADIGKVVGDQQFTLVSLVAGEIDDRLLSRQRLLIAVAKAIPAGIVDDVVRLENNLSNKPGLGSAFDILFFISAKGRTLVDIPAAGRRGIDVADREYFKQTMQTRKPYISQPFLGRALKRPVIMFTVPVLDDRGEVVGILGAALDLLGDNFLGKLRTATVGRTGVFALFGRDRTLVMSRDTERIMTPGPAPGVSPYFDRAVAGQEGWEEAVNSRGLHALFSYKPLQAVPWVLVAALPVAEAYAPVALAQKRIAGIGIVLALLIAPVIWFATRRVLAPLLMLRDAIRRMRNEPDGRNEVPISRNDEIGDLAADFNALMREKARGRDALRESEGRLRAVFEQAAVGMALIDGKGYYLDVNQKMCDIVRYAKEELVGTHLNQIVHPDDMPATLDYRAKRKRGEISSYSHEKRYVTKDQEVIWVNATAASVIGASGEISQVISVVQDITERKRAEQALRESEALFRAMSDNSPLGVFLTDAAGNYTYVNEMFRNISGLTSQQALGQGWRSGIHPEDRDSVIAAWGNAVRDKTGFEAEFRCVRANGSVVWTHVKASPFDERGKELGHVGTMQDITERVQSTRQLERLNATLDERVRQRTAALQQSNKELEAYSYTVAHNMRAPLRHIEGFARELELHSGGKLDAKAQRLLATIRASAKLQARLIDDLLEYARLNQQDIRRETVDLNLLVAELVSAIKTSLDAKPATLWRIGKLPVIVGDRLLLRHLFANLLDNAVKYSARKETPSIEIGCRGEEDGKAGIYVRDNGDGFDMRFAHKLFGMFQRLHHERDFPGTGIGLAIVRRIAERLGGSVFAEGEVGKGATISVILPLEPLSSDNSA